MFRPGKFLLTLGWLAVLMAVGLWLAPPVYADTIHVTNNSNTGAGSLRQAIINAVSGDTIVFDISNQTITLASTLVIGKNLTIDGSASQITVSGNDLERVFSITAGQTVTINNLTIANGRFTFNSNSPARGGGIDNAGTLTIINSTLLNNVASNIRNNGNFSADAQGGAIHSSGALTIINSTFSGNSASVTGVPSNGTPEGSAIYVSAGTAKLSQVTIVGSVATGVHTAILGVTTIKNSIIQGHAGNDCVTATQQGNNLIDDGLDCGAFTAATNLGSLALNGGDTQTIALPDNSNAIDAASDCTTAESAAVTTDQRGTLRPQDGDNSGVAICDIGAYEYQRPNNAPTALGLSNSAVDENEPSATVVGDFSTTDPDAIDTFVYSLVAGAGDDDNALFSISGDQLQTAASFDFETQNSFSIRVRTTDPGSLFFEQVFTITVNDINEAPTAIDLIPNALDENEPADTEVGDFSTTDADAGNTFVYSLVNGAGDDDNASFTISNNQLQTAASFDFETQSSFSIRVRTTDQGSLFFEQVFIITVNDINEAPTALNLAPSAVDENQPSATVVGDFSTTDADAGNTFAYSLVSGAGDDDNASFNISGNQLQTAAGFDFETQSSFSIRVRTTDPGSLVFEQVFTIAVNDINEAPTALGLSNSAVDENEPSATVVGDFSTTDVDTGDAFVYSLVSGAGDDDNASFSISGDQLLTAASFDFESQSSFSIRVRTTDPGSLFFEQVFIITVNDINEAPTALNLAPSAVDENQPSATVVGSFSTTDPDAGNTFVYSLVSGAGDDDNASFSISGDQLQTAASFNFETQNSFSIRVRTTDPGSLFFEQVFIITVNDINEAPTALNLAPSAVDENQPSATVVGSFSTTDPDAGNTFVYSLVSGAGDDDNASFSISGDQLLTAASFDFETQNSFSIRVRTTDPGSLFFEQVFTIAVNDINEAPTANNQTITTAEDTPANITLTGGDVDGDSLIFSVVSGPLHGVLSGAAPNLVYTPHAHYHGSDSFTFKANDGQVDSNVATVSITVDPVNDAPAAHDQAITTAEDAPANVTLSANDIEGASLTFSIVSAPTHGTLSGNAPSLIYIPDANYHGADNFTFKANDGQSDSNIATVAVTVSPVNDAPTAQNQTVTTAEDAAANITLTGADVEGDSLIFSVLATPTHGALSGSAPNLVYTPNANYHGADSFTFRTNDGQAHSNVATVSITINPVNDAPVADNRSVTTEAGTAVNILLSGSDVDGDSLTFGVVDGPAHGALSAAAPNLVYTPDAGYIGPDSFTFKANDGQTDSAPATVRLAVGVVNDPPTADNQAVTTAEDTPVNITLTGSDPDGDSLTFTVVSGPANGALSGAAPNLVYTPNAGYNGPDSFTFRANDGKDDSDIATVSITVTPTNNAPAAHEQSLTTAEDVALAVTLSGSDADGDALTFSVVDAPAHGVLSGAAPDLVYTPSANYHGADSFTFKANDGQVDSNVAAVSITVSAINDAPTAGGQAITTAEDTAVNITLSGGDVDGDSLTFSVVAAPVHGVLSGAAPNLVYTPAANYHGADSFTFKTNDGQSDSNVATVTITVTPANSAPTAGSQEITTAEDTAANITLSGGDPDGDPLTFSVVDAPAHGVLSGAAPNLVYTPNANYHGADSFTFKTNDGQVDSATVTVSITVTPVNDAPIAATQTLTTGQDAAVTITLAGSDVDGDPLTFSVVSGPEHGALTAATANTAGLPLAEQSLVYTPTPGYVGPDSFSFKINDGVADSAVVSVQITVHPLGGQGDPPPTVFLPIVQK